MSGEIIYRPHTCRDGRPDEYDMPTGTIWRCECGKEFKLVLAGGRVPYPYWAWNNAPKDARTPWQKFKEWIIA